MNGKNVTHSAVLPGFIIWRQKSNFSTALSLLTQDTSKQDYLSDSK